MFRAIKFGLTVGLFGIAALIIVSIGYGLRWSDVYVSSDDYAFRDTLLVPMSGARLTALSIDSFVESGGNHHNGIDLEGAKGLPIRAAAEGFVFFASKGKGDDDRIVIRHTSVKGVMDTEYVGRFAAKVKDGDFVGRGQAIAEAPIEVKPRIHFAVYNRKNETVNPCQFIPACRAIVLTDEAVRTEAVSRADGAAPGR